MEYPIYSYFFMAAMLKMAPGEEVHPKISPFTLQILILWALNLQKNTSL